MAPFTTVKTRLASPDQVPELHHPRGLRPERGFTDVERDVWIAAGIRRHDAHIAEQCVRFGVAPAMLDMEVPGRKARFWLRSGEPVSTVRARLLEAGVEVA